MPAELAAHRRAHLAGAQAVHGVFKLRHHLAIGKPAQIAAGRGAAVLRVFACQGGKIGAAACLAVDFADAALGGGRGIIAVGAQQNVAGAVLAHRRAFGQGHALLGGAVDKGIHFFIAHACMLHHGLLLHFLADDALGDIAAQGVAADALFGGLRIKCGNGGFVALGIVRERFIDFGIGGTHIVALACLHHQRLVDELPQYLTAQFGIAHIAAFGQALAGARHGLVEVAIGDHIVVGHGGNAVDHFHIGGLGGGQCCGKKGGEHQGFQVHF